MRKISLLLGAASALAFAAAANAQAITSPPSTTAT